MTGGEGTGGEDRIGERHEEDGHRCGRERPEVRTRHVGHSERRQPTRHRAGDGQAPGRKIQRPGRRNAEDDDDQCARDSSADLVNEHEKPKRDRTDDDRRTVGVTEIAQDVDSFADDTVFVARNADQLADLAEDEDDGNSGDVPDQDCL